MYAELQSQKGSSFFSVKICGFKTPPTPERKNLSKNVIHVQTLFQKKSYVGMAAATARL